MKEILVGLYTVNAGVYILVHRRRLHLLLFAFQLKSNVDLLDFRTIPTRRRDGILFSILKTNHYKFPKNPYYRCMTEWNNLTKMFLKIRLEKYYIKINIIPSHFHLISRYHFNGVRTVYL